MKASLSPTGYYRWQSKAPPRVVGIVLTDRADGTLWWLSLQDSSGRVRITTSIPGNLRGEAHGPFDGPVLPDPTGTGEIRLLVRGGRLGYEMTTRKNANRRILVKQQTRTVVGDDPVYEIKAPSGWVNGRRLAYETGVFV